MRRHVLHILHPLACQSLDRTTSRPEYNASGHIVRVFHGKAFAQDLLLALAVLSTALTDGFLQRFADHCPIKHTQAVPWHNILEDYRCQR